MSNTISLENVTLVIAGHNITGLTSDGVKITPAEKRFSHVAAPNSITRRKSSNRSAVIEFSLLRTSTDNNVLKSIIDLDDETNNNRFGWTVVDNDTGETYLGNESYFSDYPAPAFTDSDDSDGRMYEIVCPRWRVDKVAGATA